MKEALIVDLLGNIIDVELVDDTAPDVMEVYEPDPENPEARIVVAYRVTKRPAEGMYVPCWEFEAGDWVEKLTPEEIEALHSASQPSSELDIIGAQMVQRELEVLELQHQNYILGQQIAAIEQRLLAVEGGAET